MLRTLFKSDLKQILAIEQSVHVAPWTEETFEICFRSGYFGYVIEIDNQIVGFIIAALQLGVGECHILNLGVARAFQRQGLGHQLLTYMFDHAKKSGTQIIYLEVRRSNSRAISLYKKMSFALIGERKDYYQTIVGYEDALIFARSLQDWQLN